MFCCSEGSIDEEPDGACPECGAPTFEGDAIEWCEYSPILCENCGHRPCDGSC